MTILQWTKEKANDGSSLLSLFIPGKRSVPIDLRNALLKQAGRWIDTDGQIRAWKVNRIEERDDGVQIWGEDIPGEIDHDRELPFLRDLNLLLKEAEKNQEHCTRIGADAALKTKKAVLLLSGGFCDFIFNHKEIPEQSWAAYSFSEKGNKASPAFFLSVLFYEFATGELPFLGEDEQALHREIRLGQCPPPWKLNPLVKKDLSLPFLETLVSQTGHAPDLVELGKALEQCMVDGIFQDKPKGKGMLSRVKPFARKRRALNSSERVRRMLRTWTALGALIAVIFISLLIADIATPPKNKGLEGKMLIWTYYQAINDMHLRTARDCTTRQSLRDDFKALLYLKPLINVRTTHGNKAYFIRADEWVATGMPLPDSYTIVFGITDLEIAETGENQYTCRYYLWTTLLGEDFDADNDKLSQTVFYHRQIVTDRIELSQRRKLWEMTITDRSITEGESIPVTWQESEENPFERSEE